MGVGRSAEQPVPRLNSNASLSNTQDQNKGTKLLTERALGFLKRQLLPVIFWPQKVLCGTQAGASNVTALKTFLFPLEASSLWDNWQSAWMALIRLDPSWLYRYTVKP